ncbi:MAG TPA: RpiB/LacA/LacB family sugar-phosphate isomerase [Tepidisphaeraceae bacterium]|jgi:ribose 5-phosphate isomerase B
MKVAVACDHRGFEGKKRLMIVLKAKGHSVIDYGCPTGTACDYPDFAVPAAHAVARGEADAGVLLDSSGIGMSVCANKVRGVRAAVVLDEVMARVARDANHCNILCVGTDLLPQDQLLKIVEAFLNTPYSQGRHARRVEKIARLEEILSAERTLP